MFSFKYVKIKICFIAMLISLAVLLIVFCATDDLLGDKAFSEYTHDDWSVAVLPLSIIIVSGVSTLVFAFIIIIFMARYQPAIAYYVTYKKFSDIEPKTEFFAFDHNEFKRACCCTEEPLGLWISVKEFNLKTRSWVTLEKGRCIENAGDLESVLKEDYKYDKVKLYTIPNHLQ